MKCLLFYASFGDGHVQVARALRASLEQDYHAEVVMMDPFRSTNQRLARLNEQIFELSTAMSPKLYGLSYDLTKNYSKNHPLWKMLAQLSRKAAWRALSEYEPDIVIQLFPDHALAKTPKTVEPMISVVLTDYAIHSRWFHRAVDLYVLPSSSAELESIRFRDARASTIVTGIPIRDQFAPASVVRSEKQRSIVISAGGRGVFPNLEDVVQLVLITFPQYRLIVLCGRNERMRTRMKEYASRCAAEGRVDAVGFTDDIASYFQNAAFVIGKAGGVSSAECMACGTPVIFFKPLPGQELENARSIEREGAGIVVKNLANLKATFASWTMEREEDMRRRALMLGRPHAARDAAGAIVRAWIERNI